MCFVKAPKPTEAELAAIDRREAEANDAEGRRLDRVRKRRGEFLRIRRERDRLQGAGRVTRTGGARSEGQGSLFS